MPSTTVTPSPTTGATLEFDGKSVALPMTKGSEGEIGIDIQAHTTHHLARPPILAS